jgi:hypothetical protein
MMMMMMMMMMMIDGLDSRVRFFYFLLVCHSYVVWFSACVAFILAYIFFFFFLFSLLAHVLVLLSFRFVFCTYSVSLFPFETIYLRG